MSWAAAVLTRLAAAWCGAGLACNKHAAGGVRAMHLLGQKTGRHSSSVHLTKSRVLHGGN